MRGNVVPPYTIVTEPLEGLLQELPAYVPAITLELTKRVWSVVYPQHNSVVSVFDGQTDTVQ